LIHLPGFLTNLFDFHLYADTGSLGDELDQVACPTQEVCSYPQCRKITTAALRIRRDWQFSRLLNQLPRADDPLGGWDKTGHDFSFKFSKAKLSKAIVL